MGSGLFSTKSGWKSVARGREGLVAFSCRGLACGGGGCGG